MIVDTQGHIEMIDSWGHVEMIDSWSHLEMIEWSWTNIINITVV